MHLWRYVFKGGFFIFYFFRVILYLDSVALTTEKGAREECKKRWSLTASCWHGVDRFFCWDLRGEFRGLDGARTCRK